MRDSRIEKLAELMLSHSMQIKKGEAFHITADISAIPLVQAILRQTAAIGAIADVELTQQEITRRQLELIDPDDGGFSDDFLADKAESGIRRFKNLVGDIVIRAYANDQELAGINPAVQQLAARKNRPFKDMLINQRRWVLFEYPTAGQAQRAGMSFEQYVDFVFDVSSIDYRAMRRNVQPLQQLMAKTENVRITGRDTKLSFSIKNIPVIACCGENNIPDGECFTAPVVDSVNGHVLINTPSVFWGKTFTDIRLEFAKGKIISASAKEDTKLLNQILDSDQGARFIGEFAIGFNPLIRDPFMNTLFDEKISGSFHFTPGACYDDAPNGNKSSIHWDLVHIQRPEYGGGSIWFDDVEIRRDGLFLASDLKALNP